MGENKFNEKEFVEFLQNVNDSKLYNLNYNGKHSRNMLLSKIYSDNGNHCLLEDNRYTYINDLTNIEMRSYGHKQFEAIYFRDINAIIFESSYHMDGLDKDCNELKVYTRGELYKQIHKEVNEEFLTGIETLKKMYGADREEIQNKKKENERIYAEWAVKNTVHEHSRKEYVSEHAFKEYQNLEMIYNYLKNPTKFVSDFIKKFHEDKEVLVKAITLYMIAKEESVNELSNVELIKKGKYVNNLMKTDLEGAKNIWVILADGSKKQVENTLRINSGDDIEVGRYYTETVPLENVVAIKYSRKEYDLVNSFL